MKKMLPFILASCMTLSLFAACAPAADLLDPAITLASSDAYLNAAWLDERLEEIPDNVIVGIGSNETYGIDMSNFDEDGYVLRENGGDVLIFGASEDGLDRAVRKYAKAVENGVNANLDEVYHEGARIEKLMIAGRDISEFTIIYNYDKDVKNPGAIGKTIGNAKYAAEEMWRLIEEATGKYISVMPAENYTGSGPVISMDYLTPESFGEVRFSYEVKNGSLYIKGTPDANGVACGVYYFLEQECGWEDLLFGDSVLREADLIDVAEGAAAELEPMFDYTVIRTMFYDYFDTDRSKFSSDYQGILPKTTHGMNYWVDDPDAGYCYTDETNYQYTLEQLLAQIEAYYAVPEGTDYGFYHLDIGHFDSDIYCLCKNCKKVYNEEGRTNAGAVVRHANRLAEEIDEQYDNVKLTIFAYWGTCKPCKTEVHENVFVTFCTDGHCFVHSLTEGGCSEPTLNGYEKENTHGGFINQDYADMIKGWTELTDNLYVWYYVLDNSYNAFTILENLYDDVNFMYECGVMGFQPQQDYSGIGIGRVQFQMMMAMNYNPGMTEEEYEVKLCEILDKEYGEGGIYIRKFIELWDAAQRQVDQCKSCWGYWFSYTVGNYSKEHFAASFDEMYELFEKAIALADTADQQRRCELLSVSMIFEGCVSDYFTSYEEGDEARIQVLRERYDVMYNRLVKYDFDISGAGVRGQDGNFFGLDDNLEDEMWGGVYYVVKLYDMETLPEPPAKYTSPEK